MNLIYVVMLHQGSYEDATSSPIRSFADEAAANQFAAEQPEKIACNALLDDAAFKILGVWERSHPHPEGDAGRDDPEWTAYREARTVELTRCREMVGCDASLLVHDRDFTLQVVPVPHT